MASRIRSGKESSAEMSGLQLPSPLVGGGGEVERSEIEPGEGSVSADKNPSSGTDCVRATFSHKGRREEAARRIPSLRFGDARRRGLGDELGGLQRGRA